MNLKEFCNGQRDISPNVLSDYVYIAVGIMHCNAILVSRARPSFSVLHAEKREGLVLEVIVMMM